MQMNLEGRALSFAEPTREDFVLGRLMAAWQHGEAARADPVLLNMQVRIAAELARISPDAAAKGRALFERLTSGGRAGAMSFRAWENHPLACHLATPVWCRRCGFRRSPVSVQRRLWDENAASRPSNDHDLARLKEARDILEGLMI